MWFTDQETDENLNCKLTYWIGADHSGWDYGQVLRLIPGTRNYKYKSRPKVKLLWSDGPTVVVQELRKHLENINTSIVTPTKGTQKKASGTINPFLHEAGSVIAKYSSRMRFSRVSLMKHSTVLGVDRSLYIFMIVAELWSAGASADETASVVWNSPYFFSKHGNDLDRLNSEVIGIRSKLDRKNDD